MPYADTFYDLARVNTGASFLDSGGAYGRHHEKPPVPEDHPLYYARRYGDGLDQVDLMINQPSLLSECYTVDPEATRHFRLWAALVDPNDDHAWGTLATAYCARMVEKGRWEGDETVRPPPPNIRDKDRLDWYADSGRAFQSYTYNDPDDNDLDQDYIITAPSPYAETVLVQSHNGCDARGGFTAPIVATGYDGPPRNAIEPYCHTCNDSEENMHYANERGWRLVRQEDRAVLRCPDGHLETSPDFPYVDSHGPEPDRDAPHEPEPDANRELCEWCGTGIEQDDVGDWQHKPGPVIIPKEQMPLPVAEAS